MHSDYFYLLISIFSVNCFRFIHYFKEKIKFVFFFYLQTECFSEDVYTTAIRYAYSDK